MCQFSELSDYRAIVKTVTLRQLYTSELSVFDGKQAKITPTENTLPSKKSTKVSHPLIFLKKLILFYILMSVKVISAKSPMKACKGKLICL